MSQSPRQPTARKLQTRLRLIDAAIDVLRGDGMDALTTVRITRDAGIAQSSFYEHFKNVDDCLAAVADHIRERLEDQVVALRRDDYAQQTTVADFFDREATKRALRRTLRIFTTNQRYTEVFVRYRTDKGTLGSSLQELVVLSHRSLVDDIVTTTSRLGLQVERVELDTAAWLTLSMLSGIAEAHLAGRIPDIDLAVSRMASGARAIFGAAFRASGTSPPN